MSELNGSERVQRARGKQERRDKKGWGMKLLCAADWVFDQITTIIAFVGAGSLVGVGFGFGLALVMAYLTQL